MLADIVSGQTGTADVLFLIAAILFGLGAITHLFGPAPGPEPARRYSAGWGWGNVLLFAGLTCVSVGWLVL